MNKVIILSACLVLGACSSSKYLLPDSGATSAEIIQGRAAVHSDKTGKNHPYVPVNIAANYDAKSQFSSEHVAELKRDFKFVHNPEIVGYVYPHFNQSEMPIPGYFTVFKMYVKNHYALTNEGVNE